MTALKNMFAQIFPGENGKPLTCQLESQRTTAWKSNNRWAKSTAVSMVRRARDRATKLNCETFVGKPEIDGIPPQQMFEMRWHPIFAIYDIEPLDIVEFVRVGTQGAVEQSAENWKTVKLALKKVMDIAQFSLTFASPHGLDADFLNSISRKEAKIIAPIIFELNPEVLSWLNRGEGEYIELLSEKGRFFLNFNFG